MRQLSQKFKKNGLPYQLIQWNRMVALYGIGGTYTDQILTYEVIRIKIRNDKYGYRESLPSNEQFGRDGSLAFSNIQEALIYFVELTNRIHSHQRDKNDDKSDTLNSSGDLGIRQELIMSPLHSYYGNNKNKSAATLYVENSIMEK